MIRRIVQVSAIITIVIIVIAPVVTMGLTSFCDCRFPSLPWPGWSLQWYGAFFNNSDLHQSMMMSLRIALLAATMATGIGLIVGYGLARALRERVALVLTLLTVPAVVPTFLYGMSAVYLANLIHFDRGELLVSIGHAVIFSPIVIVACYHRARQLDVGIERAAVELGAGYFRTMFEIVVPQIRLTVFASFVLVFLLSWDEFTLSWFLSSIEKTFPVEIRNMLEATISPEINSAGVFASLASFVLMVIALRIISRNAGRG